VKIRDLFMRSIVAFIFIGILVISFPFKGRISYFIACVIIFTMGFFVRLLQILYPGRFTFLGIRENLLMWYESLERHQQLYFNVFLFIPILGFTYVLDEQNLFPPMFHIFVLYCLGITVYDVIRVYSTLYNTLLGKALIAVGFAAGSNLAFCLAGWVIGEMTHVAPSTFPHTLSFLAIGAIPFLFLIIGAIYIPVAALSTPFILLASMFKENAPRFMKFFLAQKFEKTVRRYVIFTFLFQIFLYTFVVKLAPQFFYFVINRYGAQIESTIANSIYTFDMYPGTECKSTTEYRVAFLGDENYILATKTALGISFDKPQKCSLKEI